MTGLVAKNSKKFFFHRGLKKGQIGMLMLLIVSMAVINTAVSDPIATVSVEPSSIVDPTLVAGETFTVNITVTDVTDLYGFDIKLGYVTSVLTATHIALGDFFPPGSWILKNQTDDTAGADPPEKGGDPAMGYAWIAVTLPLGTTEGVDGSGTLATITFTVDALGETVLHLYGGDVASLEPYTVFIVDRGADEISRTVVDGSFNNAVVETGTVSGTVTDSSTGDPIADATVTADGNSATTDSNGDYSIPDLTPGDYTVEASADGYLTASKPATVVAGETSTVSFQLEPGVVPETGAVSGTVTDSSTGDPIADATVTADGNSATTDSNGDYSIPDLTPGDYTVEASADGYLTASKPATVVAGETSTVSFQLEPEAPEQVPDTVLYVLAGIVIIGAVAVVVYIFKLRKP